MKNNVIAFSMVLSLLFSCTQKFPAPGEIKMSWELVSNEYSDTPKAMAKFHIENNSRFTLNDKNWALYFSQMSRTPLSADNNVKIRFLSGDWFVMEPKDNFRLKPGESVEITTEHSEWIIKETDAPLGSYFIFYDKKGMETDTLPVADFTILPFTRPEQANRHKNDYEPIPTAQWNFENNQSLSLLGKEELLPFIPSPVSYKATGSKVIFDDMVSVLHNEGLENEARYIAGFLEKLAGTSPVVKEAPEPAPYSIFLEIKKIQVNEKTDEAYRLQIKPDRSIQITGSDPAGVFYGIQSLLAMLPAEVFKGNNAQISLDEVVIEDAPRFPYRGLQIDVARNFQTKETIKKMIDILSFYKGNYLVIYLTEDEGWRIEIDGLPELTDIGAKRGHTTKEANALHPSYGSGPFACEAEHYGCGYYTKNDFIEILKYAQSRHVNIIPAVNFPGHSRAAIKSMEARYEKYMALGDEENANEFRLIDPDDTSKYLSAQWYNDNVVNVARESVYKFYETVVDAILAMYNEAGIEPEFFHTGGDEVPEGAWTASPMCAELIKSLPKITDPKNLQAYFFERIVEILKTKNLKIGGWEEVALLKEADGEYAPNKKFIGEQVYPYVWNNQGSNADLAYRLANAGYPVILCNVSNFYFDLAYNKDPREPGHYWPGFVNTRNAWQVAPFNVFYTTTHDAMGKEIDIETDYATLERLDANARKNVAGVQAQIWSETVKGKEMLEYYLLPKLIGFAESAWSPERTWETTKDRNLREKEMNIGWNTFANTLAQKELPRLAGIFGGFNYRVPAPGAKIENDKLVANSAYPGLIIRYTTDGTEPTKNSTVYFEPVSVTGKIKIKAFDAAGKGSLTMEVN
ncbi:hexosaminidase [Mariniphaga anaerophila]|uniref:beta-N-acetylhexosaminidase n=1 Tax=Mariniphaga anaerophila TaxID=1484053 RepID=A0A1M5DYX7_9BACT|nr:family 20 glycosylhydrolase [Mariniphaga anaerophila]SHF72041.1 hexosaminidase [Mariniphaga anaerophila]